MIMTRIHQLPGAGHMRNIIPGWLSGLSSWQIITVDQQLRRTAMKVETLVDRHRPHRPQAIWETTVDEKI